MPINLIPPNRFQRGIKQLRTFLNDASSVVGNVVLLFFIVVFVIVVGIPLSVLTYSMQCPNCKRRGKLSWHSPKELAGITLYECHHCHARFKRTRIHQKGNTWEDASAHEYTRFFPGIK